MLGALISSLTQRMLREREEFVAGDVEEAIVEGRSGARRGRSRDNADGNVRGEMRL